MSMNIYTTGSGEFLEIILNASAMITGSGFSEDLARIGFLIGLVLLSFQAIWNGQGISFHKAGMLFVVYLLLYGPTTTAVIGVWGATEQKVHLSPAISSQHHNLGPSQLHPLLDSVPKYGSRVESWAENPRGDCRYEIPKTAADSWFDSAVIHRMGRERGRSSA
ncbi:conjugal transfer protein TraG N-terminal domain-containing protein [Pseudomonas aeruginosa]|uniref:conjugal transfer protein TraG N-terminal domain-containing protein n=1 Tax=Pseudomonas aeruginosa TaxID=287 RepID=UPI001C63AD60|nr:conjugal transfer protein TraG N-terminal domain-containing protein [Pseudomonas aeruginosa]QYG43679.1 conjugal transfer protein TraG N-terminal domain-containing protein [Pseudomonas aeruginosa]